MVVSLCFFGFLRCELEKIGTGLRGEPAGITLPDDPGVFEHIDAVGMRQRECDVLLAEQHGDRGGLPQLLQRLGQELEDDGRKSQGRFVEDQDLRLHHQRAADRQHLLFAAGECLRQLALPLFQDREQLEQPGELGGAFVVGEMLAAEIEVLPHAHLAEKLARFRALHQAAPGDPGRARTAQRLAATYDLAGVRPANGSSTSTTFGSRAIALASSSRRKSAKGSVGGRRFITAPNPTRSAIHLARSTSALSGNSMNRLSGSSATMMFSSTVCRFSGRECWNTMPKPLRAILCAGSPAMFSPSNTTSPAVGRSIPMIAFMAVDLPEPFGPIRPKISPARG